jgi:2-iminobutanoate/2-iminopropanoate deaminase
MTRTVINPPTLFESVNRWGFSQGVVVQGPGRTVYLSGQTPWDATERPVGATRAEQFRACVANIERALKPVGGTLNDVVTLRLYMVGYDPSEADDIARLLRECFPGPAPPATTWIGVTSLAQKEYLVEIEATAVLDE